MTLPKRRHLRLVRTDGYDLPLAPYLAGVAPDEPGRGSAAVGASFAEAKNGLRGWTGKPREPEVPESRRVVVSLPTLAERRAIAAEFEFAARARQKRAEREKAK
jgi:hypothetical protein